jgi:hypothetical protein
MAGNGQVYAALALQCRMHVVRRVVLSGSSKVTQLNTQNMAKKIEGYVIDNDSWLKDWVTFKQVADDSAQWSHCTIVISKKPQRVYTQDEVEKLVKALRTAYNVVDELNADGFGPLTSKEGLEAFCALVDELRVFDPA